MQNVQYFRMCLITFLNLGSGWTFLTKLTWKRNCIWNVSDHKTSNIRQNYEINMSLKIFSNWWPHITDVKLIPSLLYVYQVIYKWYFNCKYSISPQYHTHILAFLDYKSVKLSYCIIDDSMCYKIFLKITSAAFLQFQMS